MDIAKVKYHPYKIGQLYHAKKGDTVGKILRLSNFLYIMGWNLKIDCGFCIVKSIVKLHWLGVFMDNIENKYFHSYICQRMLCSMILRPDSLTSHSDTWSHRGWNKTEHIFCRLNEGRWVCHKYHVNMLHIAQIQFYKNLLEGE